MNFGLYGFPYRERGELMYGFPRQNRSFQSFFGFPSGSETYDLKVDANTNNYTLSFTIRGVSGGRIVIGRGDGNSTTHIFSGSDQTISWIYAQQGLVS